jgi:hypothetical protein
MNHTGSDARTSHPVRGGIRIGQAGLAGNGGE